MLIAFYWVLILLSSIHLLYIQDLEYEKEEDSMKGEDNEDV